MIGCGLGVLDLNILPPAASQRRQEKLLNSDCFCSVSESGDAIKTFISSNLIKARRRRPAVTQRRLDDKTAALWLHPHGSEPRGRLDSYWTVTVCEIAGRCLNKAANGAIILKQKVTSAVTTGPEINKTPN